MTMNENEPAAVDHSGLIKRIDAAIERVTKGRGLMSIPADPRSDVDLVLSECKALLQGENPPFWATDFHPPQPVQPAGAQGEPVAVLREVVSQYKQMHNWRIRHQCEHPEPGAEQKESLHRAALALAMSAAEKFLEAQPAGAQGEPVAFCVEFDQAQLGRPTMNRQEAEEVAALVPRKRRVVNLFREAPAGAVNEQLYTALEGLLAITRDSQGVAGYHLNGVIAKWDEFEEVSAAEAAIAAAEAAKGGEM